MKKNVLYKVFVIIVISLICLSFTTNASFASNIVEDIKDKALQTDTREIQFISQKIIGALRAIAIAVGIIMLVVMGIKYVSSASGDAKAEVKKAAVPYIVATILLFGASIILTAYINIASTMNS